MINRTFQISGPTSHHCLPGAAPRPEKSSWHAWLGRLSLVVVAAGTIFLPRVEAAEVSGLITANTSWKAEGGPHVVKSTVIVAGGATLSIEAGAQVHLLAGSDLVVTNGGRLLVEGTPEKPVHFGRPPGVRKRWGGIIIMGEPNSPETRIVHAHIEGNDFSAIYSAHGTLWVEAVTFGTRDRQYISLDGSSFVISRCHFRGTTGEFEPVHGSGGVKAGGRAIVRECFFGSSDGYSDIIDFTGSNRERKQPIIQFYNNVFAGSTDDEIDLDGTDGWIEGNIFLHAHKNGAPDTSSAVSGGENAGDTSQVTIIGNLFFNCDQAATAKEGNFFTMINNTIVHMTKEGGLDTADGAVCVQDLDPRPTTYGEGIYLEGNIIADVNQLVRNYVSNETRVVFRGNLLPMAWTGPGEGNFTGDPKFQKVPSLAETKFTNWASAQVLREWFRLQPGSPAAGRGAHGRDWGGVIPLGVFVSGEPTGRTTARTAELSVGPNRKEHIPPAGWPLGAGYTHYRFRLDGGEWSAETPISEPIKISGLANGSHYVEVIGKRDSGTWQNDPDLGASGSITRSKTWEVQTGQ